jgi:hypothetical protein
MVSIVGEKLHLNHLEAAVREAEGRSGLAVWQFRIIPDVPASRREVSGEGRGEGERPGLRGRIAPRLDQSELLLGLAWGTLTRRTRRQAAGRLSRQRGLGSSKAA